jgi:type VI secretion system protein ImpJ
MRQMQPVLWTKGVLLTPQHLQLQDRFLEDLLEFRLSALAFAPWGFNRLTIDREALAAGAFSVTAAAGVLPDGLLFDIPEADPAPPPKPLEGAFRPDQEALTVYLAIPEYRYGGLNVAASQGERNTRFVAEVLVRRDENTGLAEKPILVARRNFRLLVEGESLEGHIALPVARVTRAATGEHQLDLRFVPPVINIAASDYLLSIARRLVELLSAKSSMLADRRRQKNQSLAEFGISDVANFWLLYSVNTAMPGLRHLFETRQGHPRELFVAMLSLAGALTAFSAQMHPRDLPGYDHANLTGCFTDLDEKLRTLLETVVPANYVSLPLRVVAPSVYAAAIEQDRYLEAPEWYLALKTDLPAPDLIRRAPQLVKVTSANQIDQLIKRALAGLELVHVANPPGAIPIKVGHQYFRLTKSGPEWQGITRARNVAAYVPGDFPNPEVQMLVVLPSV